jgi:hypothetical protein
VLSGDIDGQGLTAVVVRELDAHSLDRHSHPAR